MYSFTTEIWISGPVPYPLQHIFLISHLFLIIMHKYQIPKTTKNSQRGCNCPIKTPTDAQTWCYPPRQREHSL